MIILPSPFESEDRKLILTLLTSNSRKRLSRWCTGLRLPLISVLSSVDCFFLTDWSINFSCLSNVFLINMLHTAELTASVVVWKTDETFRILWNRNVAYFYECMSRELFVLREKSCNISVTFPLCDMFPYLTFIFQVIHSLSWVIITV